MGDGVVQMFKKPKKAVAKAKPAKKPAPKAAEPADLAKPAAASPAGRPSYLPPPMILHALIRRERDANGREIVSMPIEVFRKLLAALAAPLFDEAEYLARNDDIRQIVREGKIPSALSHFVSDGYGERRAAAKLPVDEQWYRTIYADVAREIQTGKVRDGAHHFELFGYHEGRVPSKDYQTEVAEWHGLIKKPAGAK